MIHKQKVNKHENKQHNTKLCRITTNKKIFCMNWKYKIKYTLEINNYWAHNELPDINIRK